MAIALILTAFLMACLCYAIRYFLISYMISYDSGRDVKIIFGPFIGRYKKGDIVITYTRHYGIGKIVEAEVVHKYVNNKKVW